MTTSDIKIRQFQVSQDFSGHRLDKYLTIQQPGYSRVQISEWIKNRRVEINGHITTSPKYRILSGDYITIHIEPPKKQINPVPGHIDIVWQDQNLLVINKPPGLSVHPAASIQETTLVHYLLFHFPELESLDPVRPGIVHRLDKETSGLMLIALSKEIAQYFVSALSKHQVEKEYLAIVHGCPGNDQLEIELPIGRDPKKKTRMTVSLQDGKQAKTKYTILCTFQNKEFSLLKVSLETGRTHQIRVHLSHIGHPVLGDKVYGPRYQTSLKNRYPLIYKLCSRQMLHSWFLGFKHPSKQNNLFFTKKVPSDIYRGLVQLKRKTQVVGITGQVGCGKSSLTQLVAGNEMPKWNADKAVEELYQPGNDGWEMLRRSFGQKFFQNQDGPVDKQILFQSMQGSPRLRKEIMSLIHPLVEKHLHIFCQRYKQTRRILAEVPLLIEIGWHKKGLFDVVVGVFCPQSYRWQWLREKRGWNNEMINDMESWQFPVQDKLRECNLLVSNQGDWSLLEKKARQLRRVLQWLEAQRIKRFKSWLKEQGIW